MQQDREVIRHINGCGKESVLFHLLAEELNVSGADHERK